MTMQTQAREKVRMIEQELQPDCQQSGRLLRVWRRIIEVIGWTCIVLGIAGAILPILPAWPFILPGVLLLGPRNRRLRMAASRLRLTLRQGTRHPNQTVRAAARLLALQERTLRRSLGPLIRKWTSPEASGMAASPLRYLVLLLPPAAIAFTAFVVVKLLSFV